MLSKNFIFIVAIMGAMIMLTGGCVDVNYVMEIDEEEMVRTSIFAQIDKNAVRGKEEIEQYVQENFYRNLERAESYNVYEEENHYVFEMFITEGFRQFPFGRQLGIVTTSHSDLLTGYFYNVGLDTTGYYKRQGSRSGFFYDLHGVTANVSIPLVAQEGFLRQDNLKGEDVDIRLTLVSSPRVIDHNAAQASDNGSVLTWNIDPYREKEVSFRYRIIKIPSIIKFLVLVTGIIFAIRIFRLKARGKDD